jgi:hypothetical protein
MAKGGMKKGQRHIILSFGIAILFVLFVGYAIQTIYPSPEYDDFCEEVKPAVIIENEEQCDANDGKWRGYDEGVRAPKVVGEGSVTGWCDRDFYCQEDYDVADENYSRNLFFISLVLGLIVFILAIYLMVESVSVGFMGGAVLLIVYGTIRHWGSLSDTWRTIMLGFALVCLVYLGYKKLR